MSRPLPLLAVLILGAVAQLAMPSTAPGANPRRRADCLGSPVENGHRQCCERN